MKEQTIVGIAKVKHPQNKSEIRSALFYLMEPSHLYPAGGDGLKVLETLEAIIYQEGNDKMGVSVNVNPKLMSELNALADRRIYSNKDEAVEDAIRFLIALRKDSYL